MYQRTGPCGGMAERYYVGPYGVEAAPTTRSDEDIRNELRNRLQFDRWVNQQAVNVEVKQGVVTLMGEVDVANEKRSAGDDAWDTPGVIDVNNQLRVRKEEPLARARRGALMRREGRRAGQRQPQEGARAGMPRTR